MTRFNAVLIGVAVVGGLAIWYATAAKPQPAALDPGGAAPVPAADGFAGFTVGNDSAPVEVVEYADFECPACAQFAVVQMPTIRQQLIEPGKVRWRHRDFPLPSHRYARLASHAAHCGGEQGKFWEMHDALFNDHSWAQTGRDPSRLFRQFAVRIGLDARGYDACMDSGRHAGRIEASRLEGVRLGVNGTPSFFVNGRRFAGRSASDEFKRIADSLIAARR